MNHPTRLATINRWVLAAVAFEVFIGGGGRLFEFGPVTLRMTLFAVAVLLSLLALLTIELDEASRLAWALTALAGVFIAASTARGLANEATVNNVLLDVRQLLYFAICPFFAIAIQTVDDVIMIARIVKTVSIILALSYLVLWAALGLGLLDFQLWYDRMNGTEEFFFRGELFFFYKGFFYLCIGVIFHLSEPRRLSLAIAALLFTALLLTLTRGFLIFTSVAALAMVASRNRRVLVLLAPLVLGSLVAAFFLLPNTDPLIASQRLESNLVRLDDTSFYLDHVAPLTFMLGEGFGIPLNDRLNVENTYMWLIYKQGIFGLLFWFIPLLIICIDYRRARHTLENRQIADAFFFSASFLFLQTATNPFLNNSIGMAFLFMTMFSMRVLASKKRRQSLSLRTALP